jgi:tRNA 2-thiouridine synthesizing protein A
MRELDDAEWLNLQARRPGAMLYGVLSTGIYCRAGCPARTPLRRNVRWLETVGDAHAAGLRACKRCKPDGAAPPDTSLDCLDLLCPLPVLKARKALSGMVPGQTLQVLTTDRMALIDLPHFCAEAGHDYLRVTETGGQARHLIRRGAGL